MENSLNPATRIHPRLKAIAAMSENRVIGRGNQLPWHLPEDFKWFKSMTVGKTIVMGRKTFESIGRALPQRRTLVLSRQLFSAEGVEGINSLESLWTRPGDEEIFICGGAEIYRQTLPWCRELLLTVVKRTVEGDAFFPPFEQIFTRVETIRDTDDFRIERWVNQGDQPQRS